jgi:hypothetical protein
VARVRIGFNQASKLVIENIEGLDCGGSTKRAWRTRVVHDTMTICKTWIARFVSRRVVVCSKLSDENERVKQKREPRRCNCCVGQVDTIYFQLSRVRVDSQRAWNREPIGSAPRARVQLLIQGGDAGCGLIEQEADIRSPKGELQRRRCIDFKYGR